MKKNVLITGSNGFLASTLTSNLDSDVNVLFFNRDTEAKDLDFYLSIADIIFHFAGEVLPTCSDDSMMNSNVGLTQYIVDKLVYLKRKTPIFYASSIHAVSVKNIYGISKRESEKILETYSIANNSNLWIYRLPHMFGPNCKPNYNSVVSTWLFNKIKGKEIRAVDNDMLMTYCYSIDLIDEIKQLITIDDNIGHVYTSPKITYKITLGNLIENICMLDEYTLFSQEQDAFIQKLTQTYLFYKKKYL